MAKKRTKPPKSNKPVKLSLFTDEAVEPPDPEKPADLNLLSTSYFRTLFTEEGFEIIDVDDQTFLVAHPEGMSLVVEVDSEMPFVTFQIPLVPKPRISKAKKLAWMNDRMIEFPMIRLMMPEDHLIFCTYDYLYPIDGKLDIDHCFMHATLFYQNCIELIETYSGVFLTMNLPVVPGL
jgi:hypothetical protein